MSPGDVDARIRRELTEHADPLADLDTHRALAGVLTGSARRRRWRQGLLVAAALAVVSGGVGARVLLQDTAETVPVAPPSLPTGAYAKDVTAGEWQGRWTMRLGASRELTLVAPDGVPGDEAPTDGSSYRVRRGELAVDAFTNGACTELVPGTYTWALRGDDLVLLPLDEPCVQREQVFAGTWRRTP